MLVDISVWVELLRDKTGSVVRAFRERMGSVFHSPLTVSMNDALSTCSIRSEIPPSPCMSISPDMPSLPCPQSCISVRLFGKEGCRLFLGSHAPFGGVCSLVWDAAALCEQRLCQTGGPRIVRKRLMLSLPPAQYRGLNPKVLGCLRHRIALFRNQPNCLFLSFAENRLLFLRLIGHFQAQCKKPYRGVHYFPTMPKWYSCFENRSQKRHLQRVLTYMANRHQVKVFKSQKCDSAILRTSVWSPHRSKLANNSSDPRYKWRQKSNAISARTSETSVSRPLCVISIINEKSQFE